MKNMVCTNCLHKGSPKREVAGSFLIEIVLYLFMIVPGIIYTIWRNTGGVSYRCKKCKSTELMSEKDFNDMIERKRQYKELLSS